MDGGPGGCVPTSVTGKRRRITPPVIFTMVAASPAYRPVPEVAEPVCNRQSGSSAARRHVDRGDRRDERMVQVPPRAAVAASCWYGPEGVDGPCACVLPQWLPPPSGRCVTPSTARRDATSGPSIEACPGARQGSRHAAARPAMGPGNRLPAYGLRDDQVRASEDKPRLQRARLEAVKPVEDGRGWRPSRSS